MNWRRLMWMRRDAWTSTWYALPHKDLDAAEVKLEMHARHGKVYIPPIEVPWPY
jgi:hypothetical protein